MDEIQAGQQAERILNDPVFQMAVQQLDADIVQKWREAGTPEEREQMHALQVALDALITQFGIIIGRGEFSAAQE